jgi:hypothetical protein
VSRGRAREAMAISERQLTAMTADLEQVNHDVAVPAMAEAIEEWTDGARFGRRGFLLTAGVIAGGATLAACLPAKPAVSSGAQARVRHPEKPNGDLAVASLAASLENLAAATYGDVLDAIAAGKLGTVPPTIASFATTVKAQHSMHAEAWNSAITGAGFSSVTTPDPVLAPVMAFDFAKATDVKSASAIALMLEDTAAATYQSAIATLQAPSSIRVAASIQPVEMQHAAILNFIIGRNPVPHAFNPLSSARPLSDVAKR